MIIVRILLLLVCLYVIFVFLLYFFQKNFIYETDDTEDAHVTLTHPVDSVVVESNGISLNGWYSEKNPTFKTLLFFHGNSGNLEKRISKLNDLNTLNINYLIVAYRGFSGNPGSPTEKGLYEDAKSCKEWLNREKRVPDDRIILYGESLGSAIALELATHYKFAGVILEGPFTSMTELVYHRYPFLPTDLILTEKFNNKQKVKLIDCPMLILHGKNDNTVPVSMGKELLDSTSTSIKKGYITNDKHSVQIDTNVQHVIKNFLEL